MSSAKRTSFGIFVCQHCEKHYSRVSSLSRHIASSHCQQNNKHKCTDCDQTFARHDNLKRHRRRRHSRASLACVHCGCKFPSTHGLQHHQDACLGNERASSPSRAPILPPMNERASPPSRALSLPPMFTVDQHGVADGQQDLELNQGHVHNDPRALEQSASQFNVTEWLNMVNESQPTDQNSTSGPMWWLNNVWYQSDDAAYHIADAWNVEAIDQIFDSLADYDDMGRINIDQWPSKTQPYVRQGCSRAS